MKHTINTIYHSIGYLLIFVGIILCIGGAGNSDLGMELSLVGRYEVSGLMMMFCGMFLTRWRV